MLRILVDGGIAASHNCTAYCADDNRCSCTSCDYRCYDTTYYHQTGQTDFGPFRFLCSLSLFFRFLLNCILHRIGNRAQTAHRIPVAFQRIFDHFIPGNGTASGCDGGSISSHQSFVGKGIGMLHIVSSKVCTAGKFCRRL